MGQGSTKSGYAIAIYNYTLSSTDSHVTSLMHLHYQIIQLMGAQGLTELLYMAKIQFPWRSYKKCWDHGPHGEPAYAKYN